jgi:DNA-binding XRE family transcriptional regulator
VANYHDLTARFAKRYSEVEGSTRKELEELRARLLPSISLIRSLREELSLSQAEIADILGVSQPSVSQLEARRDLKLSVLKKIVAAKGGSVKVVIELEEGRRIELRA